jgi:outer membrane protein OmpA-like peptidoglycan-associated protein
VNSEAEESMPIISPDGKKMFFVRTFDEKNIGGKYAGQDIWMAILDVNGNWVSPSNDFPELNNKRNNAVIGINQDETTLFLTNAYNPVNTTVLGVSKSIRIGNYWSKPNDINIKGIDSKNSFIGFFMNKDENVLLISMDFRNSFGNEDIFISLKSEAGVWSTPENLGSGINTTEIEISPFLSDDGKLLFFASNGHSGYGGLDIYMSKRLYDSWGIWSDPINLGSNVNSTAFDAYFFLQEDKAYFSSNRLGGLTDIYSTTVIASDDSMQVAPINQNKYQLTETEIQELLGMPTSRIIFFELGSSKIQESSEELIQFLANQLKNKRQYNIELIGHTSEEGTEEYNMELSVQRAKETANQFIKFGIDPLRVSTEGRGKSEPLIREGTPEELSKNRRVEIYFVK